MTDQQKFSNGQTVFFASDVRPTYLRGLKVKVLSYRRGRYDVEVLDKDQARRFAGGKVRADQHHLAAEKGKRGERAPLEQPEFGHGDTAVVKDTSPKRLNGAIVKVLGFRRGRYDCLMPVDSTLKGHSGQEVRFDAAQLQATDLEFPEPQGQAGTARVWASVAAPENHFNLPEGSPIELFRSEKEAQKYNGGLFGRKIQEVELPVMVPVILHGEDRPDAYIFDWRATEKERDELLAVRNEHGSSYVGGVRHYQEIIRHDKNLRDEARREAAAEARMS